MVYGGATAAPGTSAPDGRIMRTGRIESRSGPREMAFGLLGRIQLVAVKPGDHVSKAQLLAQLDCTVQQADLNRARAELEAHTLEFARRARGPRPQEMTVAQARLTSATAALTSEQASLQRQEALFKMKGFIPEQAVEAARQRILAAQVDVAVAQEQLERIQTPVLPEDEAQNAAQERVLKAAIARAGYQATLCKIHSPVDGVVDMVYRRAGEIVGATDAVLRLVDDAERRIALWMPDFVEEPLRLDDEVKVRLPDRSMLTAATVERIAPFMAATNVFAPAQTVSAPTGVLVWLSSSVPLSAFPLYSTVEVHLH